MNIVLLEPEIPANTGNIGRTCVSTNTGLHLIRPLGFSTEDKQLRRSGLDYWKDLKVYYYDNFDDFLNKNKDGRIFYATTKSKKLYTDVVYTNGDFVVFGKESAGIPEEILIKNKENCIRIPMDEKYRSLNLSNSAAVILYEALRQNNFDGLQYEGHLHRYNWDD